MKKILIIDDDEAIVDMLTSALSGEERSIRRAYDGQSALSWIEKENFDLVICDLMLPKVNGLELMERIKANPQLSETKILVITAKNYRRDVEQAYQVGADLFLSKPFELVDLQDKVKQLID